MEPRPSPRETSEAIAKAWVNLWILQKRPSGLVEPYELTRLREEARPIGACPGGRRIGGDRFDCQPWGTPLNPPLWADSDVVDRSIGDTL